MTQRIPLHDLTPASGVDHHTPAEPRQDAYAPRRHLYVREIQGRFQRLRRHANWALMALYFGLPWLTLGGRPAVWFDLPSREFHVLGATFYPQEFILLAWILSICAFGLFLITVFAGRVWCGYACPQSVWTFLFLWFEHRLEGPRHRRIRRDGRPPSLDTLWRKTAKHAAWLIVAAATGVTFVGYFTPIHDLVIALPLLEAHGWAYFWVGFFTLFTYLNAGWLREQVCLHMCPYARFQGVMFDSDTLVVSYDAARGEPRGKSRGQDEASGDCVDCDLCVQVCPTGIDIRDGLQYECIGCAACIDACDGVMARLKRPKGLIRYTTEHALAGRASRLWRPRLLGYLACLVVMIGVLVASLQGRTPLDLELERDRDRLYGQSTTGEITNRYRLTIRNLDDRPHRYRLTASGLPGLRLEAPEVIRVAARDSRRLPITLHVASTALTQPSQAVRVRVEALEAPALRRDGETRFLGPVPR
ncbi:cytochrome c oxidase accessory protein CcoG [Halomonas beimenensis]|uniref:cytochrome c oxidase accessory protein CcoG n=1 Tax=Halomonas beimenensis TaxID=475662 RepID=UPI0031D8A589